MILIIDRNNGTQYHCANWEIMEQFFVIVHVEDMGDFEYYDRKISHSWACEIRNLSTLKRLHKEYGIRR